MAVEKFFSRDREGDLRGVVAQVVGCKWSLLIIDMVRHGVQRPGQMARAQAGLSTKVLNQRLEKLTRFRILEREAYAEVPPRVEYRLTRFGREFVAILDALADLERRYNRDESAASKGTSEFDA